ncbi:hypothetical protein TraAM80_01769 [Trypanosoma rangeli]|uniref:Uncharacterized protein n=1 Tax=Trypanosoma rangeli TaxID=5698 RepID=A0A3R7M6L9_TRYRA|nr:uncharacterized protein TraAM80_01769 [Trypanosoma rangeli]RNF10033.1 hypothetical protein TraAM80_01769 [Trypanosoma rangeli]|eukprot:RNF10033.1 hypothetical protein TraAM80_01769 [Trypanosoma rangeli]
MMHGGSAIPGKKPSHNRGGTTCMFFDAALSTAASDAGYDLLHPPGEKATLLGGLALSPPQPDGEDGAVKSPAPDVEVLILDAVEMVLAAYNKFPIAFDTDGEVAMKSFSLRVSLTNLCTLSTLLSHRPPFSSPVLAALFQLTILVVKHAPLQALDEEGCRLLLCLVELLGCLPRGLELAGVPSIQRVARITARNVMRRVGPRLSLSAFPALSQANGTGAAPAAVKEQLNRELIPWMTRQLLPLHAVTGAAAQADLKEDRRLALSLLDFMLLGEGEEGRYGLVGSYRISMHYLADTVASLLEEKEEDGGVEGHDREVALAFLNRVDRALLAPSMDSPGSTASVGETHEGGTLYPPPPLRVQAVREFLRAKDAAYVAEFTQLHECIEQEQETHAALQQQLVVLTKEHARVQNELRDDVIRTFQGGEGDASGCTLIKSDALHKEPSEMFASSLEEWTHNLLGFLRPVEEITIALHEEQQRQRTSS